jgi:hypothetical protein
MKADPVPASLEFERYMAGLDYGEIVNDDCNVAWTFACLVARWAR